MYQGFLCSVASQWLNGDINLPLAGMGELIQTTTGLKSGFDKTILWDFESRNMEMAKAVMISDVSRVSSAM